MSGCGISFKLDFLSQHPIAIGLGDERKVKTKRNCKEKIRRERNGGEISAGTGPDLDRARDLAIMNATWQSSGRSPGSSLPPIQYLLPGRTVVWAIHPLISKAAAVRLLPTSTDTQSSVATQGATPHKVHGPCLSTPLSLYLSISLAISCSSFCRLPALAFALWSRLITPSLFC
jgi:hypothetical protein